MQTDFVHCVTMFKSFVTSGIYRITYISHIPFYRLRFSLFEWNTGDFRSFWSLQMHSSSIFIKALLKLNFIAFDVQQKKKRIHWIDEPLNRSIGIQYQKLISIELWFRWNWIVDATRFFSTARLLGKRYKHHSQSIIEKSYFSLTLHYIFPMIIDCKHHFIWPWGER